MRRRVVISGLGTLSCAGANVEEARANFVASSCCLSEIKDPRANHLKARYAGLLQNSEKQKAGIPADLGHCDKHVWMAFVAAREALTKAGVRPEKFGRRMGFIFSTCSGPMLLIEHHYERIIEGKERISPEELHAKKYFSAAPVLARALGIQGISTTVVTACTASTAAIAVAADLIRSGMLDAALAGGSDSFSTSTLAGFDGLKATSEGKCAPFSKPSGLNLGEAAAFVFLETLEAAQARGAVIHAELLGSGMSNDAYHCSSPEPNGRGLVLAMQRALQDAGLSPAQISYINAHGTGTEANDKAETRAIRRVFVERAELTPVSSTKSMVGHCLGAAGAIELIASFLCAEAGVFPATANFSGPREGCTLDYIPEPGRKWGQPRIFLSNNLAFGGHNASLALSAGAAPILSLPERNYDEPICVTSCGLISSCGIGTNSLLDAVESQKAALRPFSVSHRGEMLAGVVQNELAEKFDRRLDLRDMDRSSRWATVATRLAIREAAFPENSSALADLGLYLHLATGPSWAESEFLTSYLKNNRQVSQLVAFPYIVPGSVAGNVCRALRLAGHNLTLSCGPGAGLLGLGPAVAALRAGHAEALLTGAVDELSDRILTDQIMSGLLDAGSAPPGEGAAVLLLETTSHALRRKAKILATIRGLSFSTEPGSKLPSLVPIIDEALSQAEISREQVAALCIQGHSLEKVQVATGICPVWAERIVNVAPLTGELEGTQPLFDLAVALLRADKTAQGPHRFILSLVHSPQSGTAAVVFESGIST